MGLLRRILWTTKETIKDIGFDFLGVLISPIVQRAVVGQMGPQPTRWASINALHRSSTIDGATFGGLRPSEAWMKMALRKGLPEENERHLAVENDPHTIDDFSGVIEEGYGKGTKKLVSSDTCVLKVGAGRSVRRFNYHEHDALRAGKHFDLVVEGLEPNTRQFELNIPRGPARGRFAFVRTGRNGSGAGQIVVQRMKDRSVLMPKPQTNLKDQAFLEKCDAENQAAQKAGQSPIWSADRKYDGSLVNCTVYQDQVILRSHRAEGHPYYDKLPALESLANRSPFFVFRRLFPGPRLDGSEWQAEAVHGGGAARTGGILNAGADRARQFQHSNGAVEAYVWNLTRLRGSDVSRLPLVERRALWEEMVKEIKVFNPHWHAVEQNRNRESLADFYTRVISDRRGLPFAEGVVVKRNSDPAGAGWFKVKDSDTHDFVVVSVEPGEGKYANTLGYMVIANPETGAQGKCGSFSITDRERDWIWQNQDMVEGQIAEFKAMDQTPRGVLRAPVFKRFHPSKSDVGLLLYAEALDQQHPREMLYRLKSAAGWRR